jgi:hypothetical protein
MMCAMLLAVPAVAAIADTLAIDADGLDASNSKNSSFVLCPDDGSSVNVFATINYQGSDHFANKATVNITTSVESGAQGFITASGGSVVTGSDANAWNHSSDSVKSAAMPLTVDTDWQEGTWKVTYTATGAKAGGGTLTLQDTSNIHISEATSGCAPSNTAPVVNVEGPDDGETYEIGNVPAPSCSVNDAEDTGESATPQVSAISGPLAAYGLGQQTVTCSYTDNGGMEGTDSVTYTIVDTGDPVITDQGPTATADGNNGWYVSAVNNTFRATDSGAGFETTTPPLLQYDFDKPSGAAEGNNVTINSGTVFDVAGNESNNASSDAFKIDLTNPNVSVVLTPAAAATGWYNLATGAPTADYTCTDADGDGIAANGGASGIALNGCSPDKTFEEGANQSDTGFATDNAGRSDQSPASVSNVDVDLTAPSVGTIVHNNAASSNVCNASGPPTQPTGFFPSDGGPSGLASSGQTWTVPGTSPFGTYTYEAHATDVAGNTDSYGPENYSYTYGIGSGGLAYNGVLQPINMTGTPSVFKLGSTVPVKFTLACGSTSYGDAVAKLFVKKSDSTVASDVNEATSTAASTTGNLFRYDATAGQYIFNLSTKSGYTDASGNTQTFSAGTWQITIKFLDGTTKTATFDIKK